MTSFKKLGLVSVLAVSAMATSVASADSMGGHFGVGPVLATSPVGSDGGVAVTYYAPKFLVSATASYVKVKFDPTYGAAAVAASGNAPGTDSASAFGYGANFALRKSLGNGLNFDYGLGGAQVMLSNKADGNTNPYTVFASTGFDYQVNSSLIAYANVAPVSYGKDPFNDKLTGVFAAANMGVSYLFS